MSDVFQSIFSAVDAFIYRCANDEAYTMETMAGAVQSLTGYDVDDMLDNKRTSWVGITHPDDKERVFADVDAAIDAGRTWDVAYRIISKGGEVVWVRERGNAVHDGGDLVALEGLIVSAAAERALSDELERVVSSTRAANEEIVALAAQITSSVGQLSMLSINAQIESARSGEAGAGFSVVANEMKVLADENGRLARVITEKLKVVTG